MGGESPNMVDQSWSTLDPATAARIGVEVVMMYLSPDPSKNATAAKVRAYHGRGVAVLFGWESDASRALAGAAAGRVDALEAVRQVRAIIAAVGYSPGCPLAIYFAVDFPATPAQYPAIDAYLRAAGAVLHAEGFRLGDYGAFGVVEHTARAGITDAEWQTYAWSYGRVSAAADAYQYLNGETIAGASVDFDRIVHRAELGAWWPQGHQLDSASTTQLGGGDMPLNDADVDKIVRALKTEMPAAIWAHTYKVPGRMARRADYLLGHAYDDANGANNRAARLEAQVAGLTKLLTAAGSGLLPRLAALQNTVADLAAKVAAITPAGELKANAEAVATAVAERIKSMTWKAGE